MEFATIIFQDTNSRFKAIISGRSTYLRKKTIKARPYAFPSMELEFYEETLQVISDTNIFLEIE